MNKNSFAARMMAKQGYVEGQGLGKHGQGIATAIQAVGTDKRAGLGTNARPAEPPRKDKRNKEKSSKPSTPGTSTPKIKAPPRTKYTVAAIESRGLHVPDAVKSIIIDATGAENRTVSSISGSGFSTPAYGTPPATEQSKAAARIKMSLTAYAQSWDASKDDEERLAAEETQVSASIALYDEEQQKYNDLITTFERVTADDSATARSWDDVVTRLSTIQTAYEPYISDLDLTALAVSCLESPLRNALVDWDPLTNPGFLVASLQSLSVLLQLSKLRSVHPRKRTTLFETLLLQHWYPHVRTTLQHDWDLYDPIPATTLLTAWQPLLPPWLLAKLLSELILPRLLEGVRRFPKRAEQPSLSTNGAKSAQRSRKSTAPDLHAWLFDWWSLLSASTLQLELFPELRHALKSKITSDVWPSWKPLLGSDKPRAAAQQAKQPSAARTVQIPTADEEERGFRDLVEEWCADNDLFLQSTGKSDDFGRLLYRLADVAGSGKGLRVHFEGEAVVDGDGVPWGLDEELVFRVSGRTA
jgi:hypothetical protein